MDRLAIRCSLPLLFTALSLAPASRAAGDEATSLGRYIPSNVHSYIRSRATPAQSRLTEPYWRAFVKLKDSGIGRDLFDLVTIKMPAEKRSEILAIIERVFAMLAKPQWGELLKEEVAFGFRMALPPEYLVLFHVPEAEATKRRLELREVLDGIRGFAPDYLMVTDAARFGGEVSSLAFTGAPFALSVGSKRSVIAIATSDFFLDECFRLMDKEDAAGSIVKDPRYAAAFEGLPPRDAVESYVDFSTYMSFFREMLNAAGSQVQRDPDAAAGLSIVKTVIDELAYLGTVAAVSRADGDRWVSETRVAFAGGGKPGTIETLIRDQKPVENFARAVPKDATSFYLTSGLDWAKVYDGIAGLIRERLPRGPALLEEWAKIQDRIGFHPRDDLLSWLEGGCGIVCVPRQPTGTGTEFVLYARVRDEEKAKKFVKETLNKAKDFLAGRGQALEFEEQPELGPGYRVCRLAALPACRPVLGFAEGALVLAGSSQTLQRVRATFRGEAPSIRENPRFAAINPPEGPLWDVYYEDVEGSLQGLADLLGGLGLVASIVPEQHETRPLIKAGAILTKLSAFLRDIDLGLDSGGWTRYDPEKHLIHSRQVIRQRVPEGTSSKL